ncbi:hypothetical protein ILUMI_09510 [Ignelater luminosus]|uniref:Zinc finger protein 830 n=1 Tax=Ignelater luminosus TaxID=2038154 RepID=A0A8K0D433_IGNLU|nr:hypothetical protein ILUMI_09510 [Ignelater luminosus]
MSATFKNAKKKLSQVELRKYMNEHKNKLKTDKKSISIFSLILFYTYNDLGQLICILCQSVVRSDAVWPVHINSKQHRDKVEQAKKLKEKTNNFTTPLKRPLTPPIEVSNKKIKGILKNAPSRKEETETDVGVSGIPIDFFDNNSSKTQELNNQSNIIVEKSEDKMEVDHQAAIPEGFFDDPKQDAKARNIDYKDPIEEEWEKFQKAIRDADNESAAIIAEDQEEATNERQIDEIDEQMKNWSRVLTLERKKTEVISTVNKETANPQNEQNSEDEDDFDEYLDWRSKRSFKR